MASGSGPYGTLTGNSDPPSSLVFGNPDLLELIFENLSSSSKRFLFRAAMISRTTAEPAFNVLWREMTSLWPLFRILPTLVKDESGNYKLTDGIRDEHIDRVLFYARRIRVLCFHAERTDPYSKLHRNLLMNFIARINKLGAFSRLRKLLIHDENFNGQVSTTLFPISAPNLETIQLFAWTGSNETITSAFLRTLVDEAENMKTFDLKGIFTSGNIFNVLPSFHRLQHLIIDADDSIIPMSFLKRIASSMTSLRTLKMYLRSCRVPHDHLDNDRPTYSNNTPFTFRSLTNLDLRGDVKNILDVLHVPLLESLALVPYRTGASTDNSEIPAFTQRFNEINSRHAKDRLKNSFLLFKSSAPIDFAFHLSSFVSYDQLQTLRIETTRLSIPTSALSNFLSVNGHWSNLQHLKLDYEKATDAKSLSMTALSLLAHFCPKLSKLEIAIYHPDQLTIQTELSKTRKPHNLHTLVFLNLPTVWTYSVSFAVNLADFLDQLFPRLTVAELATFSYIRQADPESCQDWWDGVRATLKLCQRLKGIPIFLI